MIKVLHIINGADLGGISSMLLNYYRNIDRNMFHFDFIYSIDEPLGYNGKELQKIGAHFIYVPKKSESLKDHVAGIEKVLKEGQYDAIHVHSSLTSYVALAVAKRCGIKVRIAHAHNAVKEIKGIKAKVNRLLGNALIRHYATVRLACSKDAAIYTFGGRSLEEPNVRILPNAITPTKYAYSSDLRARKRIELNISSNMFIFGTVGRMTIEKNQMFLVDVLKEVIKIIPNTEMLLVGDGDLRAEIEKKVQQEGLLQNVIFTGQRTDVPELLNVFDVFVMPSHYEGFPVAGVEAGANGLPIVLSDTITRELGFLPNVNYISLNESSTNWAKRIASYYGKSRNRNAIDAIKANSYDIENSTKILARIYSGDKQK